MATNTALDDRLMLEAQRGGHHKTKRDAVTQAQIEYIQRHKQSKILSHFWQSEFAEGYDPKSGRNRS